MLGRIKNRKFHKNSYRTFSKNHENSKNSSKKKANVSIQTLESNFKKFNPINAPKECIIDLIQFLDPNEAEKCQLVCKKWRDFFESSRHNLPTGQPQAVDFDSDGKIAYITRRQFLPRGKISKLSMYLTAELLSKFEKNTKCTQVKIRVKFLYLYVWEASRLALLQDFFDCFIVDFATISLSHPETDFLVRHPKFIPSSLGDSKLNISLRDKTPSSCSIEEVFQFITYPKFPDANKHTLEFQYLTEERAMKLVTKLFELFQDNAEVGRYFTRFDFQTLEWNTIEKIEKFIEETQMEKTVIADGEDGGFVMLRYQLVRADNWLFKIDITDDDVCIYVRPNN